MEQQTAQQILTKAADDLEIGTTLRWRRNLFFLDGRTKGFCEVCAHGAIAYVSNPENDKFSMSAFHYYRFHVSRNLPYKSQPELAHLLAVKVGLTTEFNDAKDTTKEMVIEKLREAAKLYDTYVKELIEHGK